ncbi:EAL domain-containing protein [Vibrio mediterranei]|nr:EAL domain-containing protein [Vibrio mediterranei]
MCTQIDRFITSTIESSISFQYKMQGIYSVRGQCLGYEILIDSRRSRETSLDPNFHQDLMFSSSANYLLERIKVAIEHGTFKCDWSGKHMFLNLERSNLCDITLLSGLIELNNYLLEKQIRLVVEITERNVCENCVRIIEGLILLKQNGVVMAVDDYDIYKSDFRANELEMKLYEFIKIQSPSCERELDALEAFEQIRPEKIIMEHVESTSIFKMLINLNKIFWGYQGYWFDKGAAIDI